METCERKGNKAGAPDPIMIASGATLHPARGVGRLQNALFPLLVHLNGVRWLMTGMDLMLLTGIYLVNAQCSPHMPVMTNPSIGTLLSTS